MRFSDVMLSVSFVGLAAAEPLPTRPAYRLCSHGHDGVHCIPLDRSPSTPTCPTAKVHVATETVHAPIATTTVHVPTTTATIRAIPTATETRYKLEFATPSSAASRRYSVPRLFMLPHRIMGLMAGVQPAVARGATKTVITVTTQTTTKTVHAFSVTTEVEPAVTKVLLPTTEPTRTKTETVHAFVVTTESEPVFTKVLVPTTEAKPGLPFASTAGGNNGGNNGDYDRDYIGSSHTGSDGSEWNELGKYGNPPLLARRAIPSDELPTTTFVPATTETFLPQPTSTVPATTETILPQPTSTVEIIHVVMPELDTINVSINTDTDKTDTDKADTDTFTQTSSVWVSPSVILPSVSTEPTVTNTQTVKETAQTTKTWEITNHVRSGTATVSYVPATGGASKSAQPPKVFSLLASLFRM
ncbi:hypothetical protein DIS24_g4949 [Lasiodiplodia hormozganensis]|uniref:Uncharacterized protein n=1 Tax=Lasiodiplodia hormozganensis TaxID=869390 RepID=A0AA40D0D5_9PEZI|nr:hypothetical protein DIS24_g4949 [Lasiodiplodia hormozganensis]